MPRELANPDVSKLGASIRAARNRANLSQRELARRLSLSPGMISQLEKGHSQPSVTTLLSLAHCLEVSIDSLFASTVNDTDEPTQIRADTDTDIAHHYVQSGGPVEPFERSIPAVHRRPAPAASMDEMVVRHDDSRSIIKMQSGVTWELLTPDQNHPIMFMLVTYPPGSQTNPDGEFVRHTDFEYFYMLDGALEVYIDFESTQLRQGDAMWFDSNRPHNFVNSGDVPARGVWSLLPQI